MRHSIWPRSLISGLTWVLLGVVLLQFAGNNYLYERAEDHKLTTLHIDTIAKQLVVAARVMSNARIEDRPALANAFSSYGMDISWQKTSAVEQMLPGSQEGRPLTERILVLAPDLRIRETAIYTNGVTSDERGEIRLPDNTIITYRLRRFEGEFSGLVSSLLSTALLAVGLIGIAVMIFRALGASYRSLVKAADSIGHVSHVTVPVQGPREVRHLARAFNAMQERISRLISDRTQALAAVSHDLRTPIARLRLRVEGIGDIHVRSAVEDDLDEMENMISSVLSYLKGEVDSEEPRPVDMVALITTIVDAATDAGADAFYQGPAYLAAIIRPLAIKRAISNLIENALEYGGCARVSVHSSRELIVVTIEDRGSGIDPTELERVFEPFYRLEKSRNRNTGGVGLGLAIARRAVEAESGSLTLSNRAGGGLRAEVALPRN